MQITSASESHTAEIAATFAREIVPPAIIFLHGTLGMGKTVFARSLIRALTGDPELDVPSPTFTLVQIYDTPKAPLWHFDLYRLKDPEEIYELGWEEALDGNIVLVEWPERLGPLAPANVTNITLSPVPDNPDARQIEIAP